MPRSTTPTVWFDVMARDSRGFSDTCSLGCAAGLDTKLGLAKALGQPLPLGCNDPVIPCV